jgi:chromosome segregation ATPase
LQSRSTPSKLEVSHPGNGAKRLDTARELHLARTRAAELEARIAELGSRLLDAEQRSSELVRTRARLTEVELELQRTKNDVGVLREQLSVSEAARRQAEHWLMRVNTSASWRITAPLRTTKTRMRTLFGR